MEFQSKVFVEELRSYRVRKCLTIKELAYAMSSKIEELTEAQARHYLEGRCPRSPNVRDQIIQLLDLNFSRIYMMVGADSDLDYELIQSSYCRYINSRRFYEAQDQVGFAVLSILRAGRNFNLAMDASYTEGNWRLTFNASEGGSPFYLVLRPASILYLILEDRMGSSLFVVTYTERSLSYLLERVRKEIYELKNNV